MSVKSDILVFITKYPGLCKYEILDLIASTYTKKQLSACLNNLVWLGYLKTVKQSEGLTYFIK